MGVARTCLKGVTHYVPSKAYEGYTLFSAMQRRGAWLINMRGEIVHYWETVYTPHFARLQPNGNLLYASVRGGIMGPGMAYLFGGATEGSEKSSSGGVTLLEVDFEGDLVWKYEVPQFNHDFNRLENGNTIFIKYVPVPDDIKTKVKGGLPHGNPKTMWADAIVEITPDGRIAWEWNAFEHLDPDLDIICPLAYRVEWTHMNTCTPLSDENILTSFRQTNTICMIDKKSGDITWRWGPGELGHQHEPTMLENGNILVFDNGAHRVSNELVDYSRVVEVNPKTNKIEWEYKDDPPSEFFTAVAGGCQRLPNGNTLITETESGRVFEVTYDGEIVWEFVNPFFGSFLSFGRCNWIYRAYRYGTDYEGLNGKDLDPGRFDWLNGVYGADAFNDR